MTIGGNCEPYIDALMGERDAGKNYRQSPIVPDKKVKDRSRGASRIDTSIEWRHPAWFWDALDNSETECSMSEATDQAEARERRMDDNDAKAIEVIADALGGLGYELNSGLEVAQFMQALAGREMTNWLTPRDAVPNTEGFIYTEAHAAVVRDMKNQMPDSLLLDRLIDVPVGSRVIA